MKMAQCYSTQPQSAREKATNGFVLKGCRWPTLTSRADGIGVLILGAEDGHLHHPQENHPRYPELDPQQILPVARRPDKPEQAVQDVHDAHHHVELGTGSKALDNEASGHLDIEAPAKDTSFRKARS